MSPSTIASRFLGACLGFALVTACGSPGTAGISSERAAGSWIEPAAYKHILIYAGGDEASYVLTFPKGRVVGRIAESALGVCSDAGGDVFFTQVNAILEFAHGGTTPITTFDVGGTAYSCSVDPTTGNLATVVYCISQCSGDEIVVLRTPGEAPQTYVVPQLRTLLYCAYDDKGNLFVDGDNGLRFGLTELPAGATAFMRIKLDRTIDHGAQMQWDGTDLAIESNLQPSIHRVKISGLSGRVVAVTTLTGVGERAAQFWIADGKVAVPTGPRNKRAVEIRFWNYPAGGNPTNTFADFIGGGHQVIDGVTFSRAPRS